MLLYTWAKDQKGIPKIKRQKEGEKVRKEKKGQKRRKKIKGDVPILRRRETFLLAHIILKKR